MELRIELEPGADPIAGVVHRPGAQPQRFVGWMVLVELIGAAAADLAESPSDAEEGR